MVGQVACSNSSSSSPGAGAPFVDAVFDPSPTTRRSGAGRYGEDPPPVVCSPPALVALWVKLLAELQRRQLVGSSGDDNLVTSSDGDNLVASSDGGGIGNFFTSSTATAPITSSPMAAVATSSAAPSMAATLTTSSPTAAVATSSAARRWRRQLLHQRRR